eukprot:249608_1
MGECCSALQGVGKDAANYIGKESTDAGQSLLDHVNDKMKSKMDEVLNERLLERCDTTFDKTVDKLVDKTLEKTFDRAFNILDEKLEDKSKEEKIKQETRTILSNWGLTKNLIDTMDQNGYLLDQDRWNELKEKPQLLSDMGFTYRFIEIFMDGMKGREKPKTKREEAVEKLKDWGIPQILITAMDSDGWLDERNWSELRRDQLKEMGFGDGHIVLFMNGMNKIKQKKIAATQTLKTWGISQTLIEAMDEEGYLIEDRWDELRNNVAELKRMNFQFKYIQLFLDGIKSRDYDEPHEILQTWGIKDDSIKRLASERKLDESNWKNLTEEELKQMDFDQDEINLFKKKFKQRIDKKAREQRERKGHHEDVDPSEILREWGIPSDLINKLKEEGWLHPQYWDDLLDQEYELEDLGFKHGHISSFKRKFQVWKEKQDSERKERKIQLLRKLEKPQKKQSSILKRNIDVENNTRELIKVKI